jgi:hypothetical protein
MPLSGEFEMSAEVVGYFLVDGGEPICLECGEEIPEEDIEPQWESHCGKHHPDCPNGGH